MVGSLTRRQLLRVAGFAWLAQGVGAAVPRRAYALARRRFLLPEQRTTLGAAVERLIPADQDPGALELGGVGYIDGLLGAFLDFDAGRARAPRIFGGGPFSGRHGGAPRFGHFLRLSRVQEIAWRMRIEGSRGFAEREFNGPVRGLQAIYAEGLADLERRAQARAGKAFAVLPPEDRDAVLREADQAFVDLVYHHAIEAMYAPPEYGGNRGLGGWRYIHFEGDRQPVGYARYDAVERRYVELERTPVSRADPVPRGTPRPALAALPPGVTDPLAGPRHAAWLRLRLARGP